MLRGEMKVLFNTDRNSHGFGYRTGGARSVRGYKYYSLGRARAKRW